MNDERDAERAPDEPPHDEELVALLRRVRPAGPRPELRSRILGASVGPRALAWAAAAAALLAVAVGLPVWTSRLAASALRPGAIDMPVQPLADLMGGTEDAQRAAVLIMATERLRAERDAVRGGASAAVNP